MSDRGCGEMRRKELQRDADRIDAGFAAAKENERLRAQLKEAKSKLAAIEGVQRYKVTAVHLAIKAVTEERKFSDGDWIKAADIDAILRGEDT